MDAGEAVRLLLTPRQLYSLAEVAGRASLVPTVPGIYGWHFDELPCELLFSGPRRPAPWLLYVGIAPAAPGRQSTLRTRINRHASGRATVSTLRLTLGCLLADKLDIALRKSTSGRLHFGAGEAALSAWMEAHAHVAWVPHPQPWTIEAGVVQRLDLPLNRAHNGHHPFYATLGRILTEARRSARLL